MAPGLGELALVGAAQVAAQQGVLGAVWRLASYVPGTPPWRRAAVVVVMARAAQGRGWGCGVEAPPACGYACQEAGMSSTGAAKSLDLPTAANHSAGHLPACSPLA